MVMQFEEDTELCLNRQKRSVQRAEKLQCHLLAQGSDFLRSITQSLNILSMRKMAGNTANKDGEPIAKRKRIPNSLYHNEMFIVMETSPDKMKMKSRKTEPIPEHVIAQGRKSAEKRKSLANLDTGKKRKSNSAEELPMKTSVRAASVAQKKNHEEDGKQLKNTPKSALKLPHKKFTAPIKLEEEEEDEEEDEEEEEDEAEEKVDARLLKPPKLEVSIAPTSDCDDTDFNAGSKFNSYDDFCNIFECWKLKRSHSFRVASSETLKNIDGSVDPRCRYRYVVYQCVHYGQPRIRGTGKRPNQNYLPCGCRAMLRIVYNFTEKVLVITKLITTHTGHEIGSTFVEFSSQSKKLYHKAVKSEPSQSPNVVKRENATSSSLNHANSPPAVEEKEPEQMTDALYYQQQLQLMAALLPPTMGGMSADYSNVFNNYNIQNVANPDTVYRPQPQYSLSAVHNSAFSRVQPLSTSTTPPNDKENSTHASTTMSTKMELPDCTHPPALTVMENATWTPREYSDLTVL